MHAFKELAPILEQMSVAEADDRVFDVDAAARELAVSADVVRDRCEVIERWGLALIGWDEGGSPHVLEAGRQYLAAGGRFERDVLRFLPTIIDDLHARAAFLHAGTVMVDEFSGAIVTRSAVDHARSIVPAAFAPAITNATAVKLFAAAVALMARLSDGEPAGCVAEEILAVELMAGARAWIEMEEGSGVLSAEEARRATSEVRGLFELFEDDDVLDLFEMKEPADAALAGRSARNVQMGVADQRLEAWFEPFRWTIATGYLGK